MGNRILVVDDEDLTRTYLSSILKKNGYEVVLAENGVDGLNKALEEKPDLIVTDVMMPKKNGINLLQELRVNPDMKNIPIIMLSAVQSYLDSAHKEINNPETLKTMRLLLENIDSTIENFFYRFRSYRKMLFMEVEGQIEDYKEGRSVYGYRVLPDVFIDKPIDPNNLIQAINGLLGKKE